MQASQSFFARHSATIQLVGWAVFFISTVLEGYLDLPHAFTVPIAAYMILIGAPFVIAAALVAPPPAAQSPKSLRLFLRVSPWLLGGWWCFAVFLFVASIVEAAHMRGILW